MPKTARHTLGTRAVTAALNLLTLLLHAQHDGVSQMRLNALTKASEQLELLKVLVRLAHDARALSTGQYLQLAEQVVEIGKMLGGWLRVTAATVAAATARP